MFSNLNATKKGMILVMVPVLFELCFVSALGVLLLTAEKDFDGLRHSKEAILGMRRHDALAMKISIDLGSGFDQPSAPQLDRLEKAVTFFSNPDTVCGLEPKLFPEVTAVSEKAASVDREIIALIKRAREALNNHIEPGGGQRKAVCDELAGNTGTLIRIVMHTGPLTKQILEIEERVHGMEPHMLMDFKNTLASLIAFGLILSSAVSLGLAGLISRDINFRLKKIADNARLLASREGLPEADKGQDEIAELDRALHQAGDVLAYAGRKERAVLDNTAAVICTLDRRLKFVAINATATFLWHYDGDELLGLSLLTLLKADAVDETRELFMQIAQGSGQGTLENDIRCSDSSLVTCQWTVHWMPDKNQYYCVVHDVTELRSTERFKQQLLSIASHDLRAPLTAAGINLSLLLEEKRGALAEGTRQELNKSQQTLGNLMQLVNNLLKLEKFGSASFALESACIGAANIFAEAKQAVRPLADKAGVSFKGPVGDAALLGDERLLIEATINLLTNAIKFTPEGSSITLAIVGVKNGKEPKHWVDLRVTDQGPGIAKEEQAIAFNKFHQTRATKNMVDDISGTGLGLAIVKEIVRAHAGECGVESEPEKGSTFWMRIPEFCDDFEEEV